MVDIFDEVEEELRAERAKQIFKRYGGVMIAGAVLIVGAVAGWQGWRWYEARRDEAAAAGYIAAMTLADAPGAGTSEAARKAAVSAFAKVAEAAPEGYTTLARLREAALKAETGDLPGAIALWDRVSGDASADPLLRGLATLLWAQHQIDSGDPALLEARLKGLAVADSPWRVLAEEQLALLDMRRGNTDQAKTMLKRLAADGGAPSGVRERAGGLLSRLGG